MKNLVILISGVGSNMAAILDASRTEKWDETLGARVSLVISNRADAAGLERARVCQIETAVLDHRSFPSRGAFDSALAEMIEEQQPALVALAGFMRILGPAFVDRFQGRLINIHPSLLPAFPGLLTHERVLRSGCRVSGATVHRVTADLDHGPILGQACVPVLSGDDAEQLAARVLSQEHLLYPRVLRELLGSGKV